MTDEERIAKRREYFRKYHVKNKERLNERFCKYRESNKEIISERNCKYRESNRERINKKKLEYYAKNKERLLEQSRKYRESNREKCNERSRKCYARDPRAQMVKNAKVRAKKFGLPFELSVEKMEWPEFCPVFGVKLQYESDQRVDGKLHRSPNRATIDRIIPELGYTLANTRIISHEANRLKNNHTVETLRAVLDYTERETGAGRSNSQK